MINNRQNGRRRGRGGARPQGAPQGNARDNRQRGNAAQLLEKYRSLARDSQMAGDRVQTEYYLQFAEHYFRVLGENRPRYEEQQRGRADAFRDDYDDGDEFEGDENEAAAPEREERYERADGGGGGGGGRDDDGRGEGRRARGDRGERFERGERTERNDRDRGERQREGGPREGGQREGGQPRDGGQRGDRPRFRREERADERPREVAAEPAAPAAPTAPATNDLRAQADEGERLDLAILPPAIGVLASEGEPVDGADAPKPRRRPRRPRAAAGDDATGGEAPVAAE